MAGRRRLSQEEQALLPGAFDGKYANRDRALFFLGKHAGFRVSEMLSLSVGDVLQGGTLVDILTVQRRHMKGGKGETPKAHGRSVPLHRHVHEALRVWLDELATWGPVVPTDPLFRSRQRGKDGQVRAICRQQAYRVLMGAFQSLKMTGPLGCHSLRKSYAFNVYDKSGHNILAVQRALGHANVATTMRYLDISEQEVFEFILAAD
jgi:integrase